MSVEDLVLASTSSYRRMLLDRLGLPYRWRAPLVDEEALKSETSDPVALAEFLAHAKAASLVDEEPAATLIGCDQLVSFRGAILGKPGDAAKCVEQLRSLSGRTHELITSFCVLRRGEARRHTDRTLLTMRTLEEDEIARIVAADRSWDCAGGYKIERRGTWLFERIETADPSAIIGLPLFALASILREWGVRVPA